MGDGINFQMLKYNLLRHNGDRLYPTKDEIDLINRARKDAKGAWSSVLQDDELLSIMVCAYYNTIHPVRNSKYFRLSLHRKMAMHLVGSWSPCRYSLRHTSAVKGI